MPYYAEVMVEHTALETLTDGDFVSYVGTDTTDIPVKRKVQKLNTDLGKNFVAGIVVIGTLLTEGAGTATAAAGDVVRVIKRGTHPKANVDINIGSEDGMLLVVGATPGRANWTSEDAISYRIGYLLSAVDVNNRASVMVNVP